MKSTPLAHDFSHGTWVHNFIGRNSYELVCGDIADAIAGGLNRMHFNGCQFSQNIRHIFNFRPVKLQVLARTKMAISFVVFVSNIA